MQRRVFGAWMCASVLMTGAAWAQDSYPSRPISLVVPYGAGGVTDVVARALAQGMGKQLGQTVVIENKPGAGASMGVMDMRSAKPDGYRLTLAPVSIFRQPHIQKVQYDPVRDLSYIATYMTYDFVLAVPQDSPFKTVQDLVEFAKKNPGAVDYGTPGKFTANHVVMALLEQATDARFTHAPFKGDAEALNSLMAGHIKSGVYANTVLPYLSSGKLRALASASGCGPRPLPTCPRSARPVMPSMCPRPWALPGRAACRPRSCASSKPPSRPPWTTRPSARSSATTACARSSAAARSTRRSPGRRSRTRRRSCRT